MFSHISYYLSLIRNTPEYITRFASEAVGDGVLALSDRKGVVYNSYKIGKTTMTRQLSGKLHTFRNWGSYKRYFKWSGMKEANMGRTLTPADFLINEDGIIVDMYRAFDVAKNPCIPFDRIEGK